MHINDNRLTAIETAYVTALLHKCNDVIAVCNLVLTDGYEAHDVFNAVHSTNRELLKLAIKH